LFSDVEKLRLTTLPETREATGESVGHIERVVSEMRHQDRINQMLLMDTKILLPGNNLVKPDRMGMAASLEARSPYLDYRMVEFAFRTAGGMKLAEGLTKSCLKKALANKLGPELTYRKKQMFTVPVGEWFKSTRREFCQAQLNLLKSTGWLAPKFIDKIFTEHVSGRRNRTRELRALVALQLWRSVFIP
jgi:asparagine synthase (glutamine-hydrolysing)